MAKDNSTSGGKRYKTERVKTSKGRTISSTLWLNRQLNDPYVKQAKADGYRSRAAYKLLELDEKFRLFKPGDKVIDLGAAPGGWSQVVLKKVGKKGKLVGLDLLEVPPIMGADLIVLDFMDDDAPERLKTMLGSRANAVISDMASNTTGHNATDHIRIISLCDAAYQFATEVLEVGGCFVCKVLKGGTEHQLLANMKQRFSVVKHAKPKASRADSAESYVVATGFRG